MRDSRSECFACRPARPLASRIEQLIREPMIRQELARILVCPENRTPLDFASKELIAKLNRAIAAGQLKNRAGQKIEKPLVGGLVRADRDVLYAVVDDIPMMLIDEGILLDQPGLEM
jgi:uncharacterized protein